MQRHFFGSAAYQNWHPDTAQRHSFSAPAAGRGSMALLKSPHGDVIERCYRHGGLRRHLLPTWFWRSTRAQREFETTLKAFQAGVQTIEPVGYAAQAIIAPCFYRYFFYSRFQADAAPLPSQSQALLANQLAAKQMAEILFKLFKLGIYHTDLNLNNWLWLPAERKLLLIDFDKAIHHQDNPETYALRCLKRLLRSLRKLGLQSHKTTALRYCIAIAREFQINPSQLAQQLPKLDAPVGRLQRIRWKLAGGHQKNH